jgi:hypothetical protein
VSPFKCGRTAGRLPQGGPNAPAAGQPVCLVVVWVKKSGSFECTYMHHVDCWSPGCMARRVWRSESEGPRAVLAHYYSKTQQRSMNGRVIEAHHI